MDLTKLFVRVFTGAVLPEGCTSWANASETVWAGKVVFVEDEQTIYVNGLSYGFSNGAASKLDAIDALINDTAASSATLTVAEKALDPEKPTELTKVLEVAGLSFDIVKHAESEAEGAPEHTYLQILNADDEVLAEVNADEFVIDGMIEDVHWSDKEGKENVLVIEFNTAAGKEDIEVDMTQLITVLTVNVSADGGEPAEDTNIISVSGHTITVKTSTLGSVGLEKDEETGKWVPGEAGNATGLALAKDVATELANDEAVIAAALNDHEDKINDHEDRIAEAESKLADVEAWDPWVEYGAE